MIEGKRHAESWQAHLRALVEPVAQPEDGLPPLDIKAWINRVLTSGSGLKGFIARELGGGRPTHQQIAEWIIRCIANPRCDGSTEVLAAIMERRNKILWEDAQAELAKMGKR